jgi:ABC-2 type transport system ATP-binding protein
MYFGELKGLSRSAIQLWATEYLERVGLHDKLHSRVKELSSGQQQKIQLGITIINQPKLLVLDEPTKGLDPVNRELLMNILLEMNKQGSTVIFITHQMEEVEEIADRLVMIKNGRRVLYGGINEVREGFGKNTVHLQFSGLLPRNDALYSAKVTKNIAEITPAQKVSTQEIFSFLASQEINITKFEVAAPSLHEIFVEVSKDAKK